MEYYFLQKKNKNAYILIYCGKGDRPSDILMGSWKKECLKNILIQSLYK